jgi:flavin reductase (DIM6/NTAB) family NADH-FMN oxidoreductase RutF
MKSFHPDHIHPRAFYSLFTGIISPRPIAWILTKNASGVTNIAPYSFFSGINTRPPMLMVSIGMHEGEKKHTALNLLSSKECVIHIVDQTHLEKLNNSGRTFKEDESEVDILGLETEASSFVSVPKLKDCLAAIECRVHQVISLPTNDAFILEVLMLHIQDHALKDGQIDVLHVKPLSRFMGNYYGVDYDFIKKEHPNNK